MPSTAHDLDDDLESLVGTTLLDRYRIDRLLGRGGMGAVFKGHQLTLKRDVAIKVLHPSLSANEQLVKRFEREAQSTGRLEHPNIVQVLEFGRGEAGHLFIVMQLLDGRELNDLAGAPMSPERAASLMLQVFRGLEHAHANGIIHRDLKPENIFVVKDHEGRDQAKLVDFGIAKLVDSSDEHGEKMTRMGMVFGTPAYMSPEQATGVEVDSRTDLYSAGVILYELLAGVPPFQNDDPIALIRMQVAVDPAPLPDSVPEELREIVTRLMAKAKDERFDSATAVREALEAFLQGLFLSSGVVSLAEFGASGALRGGSSSLALGAGASGLGHRTTMMAGRQATGAQPVVDHAAQTNTLSSLWSRIPEPVQHVASQRRVQIASGAVLVVLVGWLAFGGGGRRGKGNTQPSPDAAQAALAVGTAPSPDGDAGAAGASGRIVAPIGGSIGVQSAIDAETLAEIDKHLTAKNGTSALEIIQPLRDKHPNDAVLLWREGKALALFATKKSAALNRYVDAAEIAAGLLDDRVFYAELYDLLHEPKLRAEAVNLSLQKLGEHGLPFLLERINEPDPNRAMGYVDRHRVLDALQKDEGYRARVDQELNMARDLWQSRKTDWACKNFRSAVEAADQNPTEYLYDHVRGVSMPSPGVAEASADCEDLPPKLAALKAKYEGLYGKGDKGSGGSGGSAEDEFILDDEPAPTDDTSTKKKSSGGKSKSSSGSGSSGSSGGRSSGSKSDCKKGFAGGIFNPNCKKGK